MAVGPKWPLLGYIVLFSGETRRVSDSRTLCGSDVKSKKSVVFDDRSMLAAKKDLNI